MAWFIGLVSVLMAAAITGTCGQTGLTAAQKQQFVDAHNILRGSVKPAATNMKTMVRACMCNCIRRACHFNIYYDII